MRKKTEKCDTCGKRVEKRIQHVNYWVCEDCYNKIHEVERENPGKELGEEELFYKNPGEELEEIAPLASDDRELALLLTEQYQIEEAHEERAREYRVAIRAIEKRIRDRVTFIQTGQKELFKP